MISSPQEIEQTAMAVANWIVYNNKPFVLPTDNGGKVYLAVLSEQDIERLQAPPMPVEAEVVEEE